MDHLNKFSTIAPILIYFPILWWKFVIKLGQNFILEGRFLKFLLIQKLNVR